MCRLLGVVAAGPAPISALVPDELRRLAALSEEHPHGWGIASLTSGGDVRVERAPERAGTSDTWRAAVERTRTDVALLHIRQASAGMPHIVANTHPFAADGMAFAHNGHAYPTAALDALIASTGTPQPEGDTDSERYFSLVRAGAAALTPPRAVLGAAERIANEAAATSLNALLLTARALVALAWWHEPTIRGAQEGEAGRDYRLWYRVATDRVVVASAFVADDGPEWRELPHGHALGVERGTLRIAVEARPTRRPSTSRSIPLRNRSLS